MLDNVVACVERSELESQVFDEGGNARKTSFRDNLDASSLTRALVSSTGQNFDLHKQ